MGIDEKVAIVTGAGSGIGYAISKKLAQERVRLVLVDIVFDGIQQLADEIKQTTGSSVLLCQTDVANEASVEKCLKQTIDEFGRLDILVNNAGISPKKSDGAKSILTEIPLSEWEEVLKVNLTSVFLMCKASIPHMLDQGGGGIVNISSSAALDGGVLAASHYSASKGAVSALTRTLAKEMAPYEIRVNAVAPGRVETAMAKLSSAERNQTALSRIPMGRFAQPDEIADSVFYLLSQQASYITGITLNVSGGYVVS